MTIDLRENCFGSQCEGRALRGGEVVVLRVALAVAAGAAGT